MKRDDTVYLRHILDAIARVETYLQGKDEAIFKQDTLLQDGVIRQIEIIAARPVCPHPQERGIEAHWQVAPASPGNGVA
jgi:uncharacterized protein with HEPN domain